MEKKIVTKVCLSCRQELEINPDNFRRDANSIDGYSDYCKPCAKIITRDFYNRSVESKGLLGWHCPLWAEKCGRCQIINNCWRLVGHIDGDEHPKKLYGILKTPLLNKKGG